MKTAFSVDLCFCNGLRTSKCNIRNVLFCDVWNLSSRDPVNLGTNVILRALLASPYRTETRVSNSNRSSQKMGEEGISHGSLPCRCLLADSMYHDAYSTFCYDLTYLFYQFLLGLTRPYCINNSILSSSPFFYTLTCPLCISVNKRCCQYSA